MGVYSNTEIKQAVTDGHIVVHPFRAENVKGSSLDLTLGEWYFGTERADSRDAYNPFDPEDVKRYFGQPKHAMKHKEWADKYGRRLFKNIPATHPIIVLSPGERILAHTHEFVGIKPPGTTEMRARSSWGRNGIAACFDAGWGDPGYINRWTMEVYNLNMHESVPLPVGERIVQMIFHHTGEVEGSYGKSGKYQTSVNIKTLVKNWRPEDMLPRAFKDRRTPPLPLKVASRRTKART